MTDSNPTMVPMHPGELLREEIIPAVKQPITLIAAGLGVSRQHLHAILAERKPVSPEMAARLTAMFGSTVETWLRLQASHDAWHVTRTVDVSAIPRLRAAERDLLAG